VAGGGALAGVAKVAAVAAIAAGGVAGGTAVVVHDSRSSGSPESNAAVDGGSAAAPDSETAADVPASKGAAAAPGRSGRGHVTGRKPRGNQPALTPPGQPKAKRGHGRVTKPVREKPDRSGRVEAAPQGTPVRGRKPKSKAKAKGGQPAPPAAQQRPHKGNSPQPGLKFE
jgi:hypothetical protein